MLVAGARPNFMKIAPIIRALERKQNPKYKENLKWKLVHTGQHYDYKMSEAFFDDLDIPSPDYFLNAGSGSHAEQTAAVMVEFERVCVLEKPDIVIVVGDVNSTLACSITAKKLNIKVAHVEAGLRSFDMTMPEEINRIVTDSISDYLFVTEKSGVENLKNEGKNTQRIFFVGNIMIDTLRYSLKKIKSGKTLGLKNSIKEGTPNYAVVTLHRPANVDDAEKLKDILLALKEIANDLDVYFPIHPRTEKNIRNFGLDSLISSPKIHVIPPQSYIEFLSLWKNAVLVLTDSGGLQEETTAIGIPCFTLRENTERPITIEEGTNTLVGTKAKGILKEYCTFKNGIRKRGKIPELWDGKTAERIISVLLKR